MLLCFALAACSEKAKSDDGSQASTVRSSYAPATSAETDAESDTSDSDADTPYEDRHGDADPKRQEANEEVMALYKKEGVNPLGGCLPLVIQIPFFYGFYRMIAQAIEMRHASWLWVHDLSQCEAGWFHVLPIVMIVTMLLLQKMTPQPAGDPAQQKMMMMMPLVFGIGFYKVSSGLVLYWLTGNLVQMGQQWFFNRTTHT